MINHDTIISVYEDKLTLMQWLKKVEEALKGASATSFSVNKKGNATISFQIDFEDGTSLESGEIILQQGESVTGASIVNGHLILTLSNGDNLDAGNLGAVSSFSIDGSQHLIVNYQDGTTNDLGAIFNGNVNISGILTASSISTPLVTSAGASVEFGKPIDVDVLTSSEDSITAQKPVIETMTGYSYVNFHGAHVEIEYAGVCKNGNKLTFVQAGRFVTDETPLAANSTVYLGAFYVPNSVMNKLVPMIEGLNLLDLRSLVASASSSNYVDVIAYATKGSGLIESAARNKSEIPANSQYAFRYELTFLLSSNLAA